MKSLLKLLSSGAADLFGRKKSPSSRNEMWGSGAYCEGFIDRLTSSEAIGWAIDRRDPGSIIDVEVFIDGNLMMRAQTSQSRPDLKEAGKSLGLGGFHASWPRDVVGPGRHVVEVRLPDGTVLEGKFSSGTMPAPHPMSAGVAVIAPGDVAIIVPVYNAADDVEICIERLARFTPPGVEVLFIDDASPDPRVAPLLDAAARNCGFRVLRNGSNLGFTRTINRGLAEVGRKHAILLNSDARVTPGWVTGMLRAAASRPRIATVTPMSDRAGAFSAPAIGNDNPLPVGVDEITYARAFRLRGLGFYPLVPTGNGFCMFVNRACLDEIGELDAEAFPRGYGEENDFCMRAGRAGWYHVVDDCTYVFHERSRSFGDEKTALLAAGRAVVVARYPEYRKAIEVFSQGPELAAARFQAQLALADCADPSAHLPARLFVVSTQAGGTPQTNMDLMREVADEAQPWLLHCDSKAITLSVLRGDKLVDIKKHRLTERVSALTHRSGEYDVVVDTWLDLVDPELVPIRHISWHSLALPALAKARGCRVVFSFQDFYTLCPTVKLLDERNVYCGGTCTSTAGDCQVEIWDQSLLPRIKDSWVHVWRQRFAEALAPCDAFITTSESARSRILAHLPLDAERFFVIPHGRNFHRLESLRSHPRRGEPVRILVPGNINDAKGLDVIKKLIDHDKDRRLEFHVLGTVSPARAADSHPAIRQLGQYSRHEFAARVKQAAPHLGAVFSIWDETFCHTLTELWSVGIPAVVFDFPTVAGRVRASGAGWVVPHEDIPALYDRLLSLSFDAGEQARADEALRRWQDGAGQGQTAGVMAASYREVYRRTLGPANDRPRIAVVVPADADLQRAPPSSFIRIWERTANATGRPFVYVRMTPQGLLANLRDGTVDGAILQRNAIPGDLVPEILAAFRANGTRYLFDLDDDLFDVPADKDPEGRYAVYASALDALVRGAAVVTASTPPLLDKLQARNPAVRLLPNRISNRLWRGNLPPRKSDGVIRALYFGNATHEGDFAMIAPALESVVAAVPNFRVAIIGISPGPLPRWAERITIPDHAKSYDSFVPWLKGQSGRFDLGLAPLTDAPFNLLKSELKVLEYGALGLPVLASDSPVYRHVADGNPNVVLVPPTVEAWRSSLLAAIERIRAGAPDRNAIRAAALSAHGIDQTLGDFDQLVLAAIGNR